VTTWLITGGAGYIGSHVVRELQVAGIRPIVFDNFSAGLHSRIPEGITVVDADVSDGDALRIALSEFDVTGVIHLAAKKAAGESVGVPLYYYQENVTGLQTLLGAMVDVGIKNFVYSSSAAVYGTQSRVTLWGN
jgi:UDP-glucose 4-epimerase